MEKDWESDFEDFADPQDERSKNGDHQKVDWNNVNQEIENDKKSDHSNYSDKIWESHEEDKNDNEDKEFNNKSAGEQDSFEDFEDPKEEVKSKDSTINASKIPENE